MTLDVWVQTCAGRKAGQGGVGDSLRRTLESLEQSDAASKYELLVAPMTPHERLGEFVWQSVQERARALCARTDPEETALLLRLEDDVIVNRHLLHNVATWPAVSEPDFVFGTLFTADGCWPEEMFWSTKPSGAVYRKDARIGHGQGWLLNARTVDAILERIPAARRKIGRRAVFDDELSQALFGWRPYYVHLPSLVNCHGGCLRRANGQRLLAGHFSHHSFELHFKRQLG
jgi:hypothetical protein